MVHARLPRLHRLLAVAGLLALSGCASLRLDRPLVSGPSGVVAREPAAPLTVPLAPAWRYNADAGFGPAAALVAGDRVIVVSRTGEVHLVEAETGERVGKVALGDAMDGTPVLVDGRLLIVPVTAGRYGLVAYDLVEGTARWRLRHEHHAAGLLLADGVLVAAALDGTVRGLDPLSGEERWALRPDSLSRFTATPAPTASGLVVVADDRGRVTALDPATGQVAWTAEVGAPVEASPAADGGLVFVPTTRGRFVALDDATGAARWTHRAEAETARFAAPAASADLLVVGASDGVVRRLDPATGAVRWTASFDGNVAAAPLPAGPLVYVGTLDSRLAALDAATGTVVWETELPGRVKTAPVAAAGVLIVLAEPKDLHAFRAQGALADGSH